MRKKVNEYTLLLVATIVLFLIYIRCVGEIGIFTVLDDEFGYWGVAAYLAGFDWSKVVSEIPYYSYGYSLVLVPLFWIFEQATSMYKAAIVLNGLFLSASFLLCYNSGKKLLGKEKKPMLLGVAFLIFMYPIYIAYSAIAWPESLLTLVVWGLVWCFIGLDQQSPYYKFPLIGVLATYSYIIHQRAIGILVASFITLLVMFLLNKINKKQLLLAIAPVVLIFIGHYFMKSNLQSGLWLNSTGRLANDYRSQVRNVSSLLTLNGGIAFLKVLAGHLFYLGAASLLIVYYGIYRLWKEIKSASETFLGDRRYDLEQPHIFFYVFVLTAFILSLLVSAVFLKNPSRIDHIVYGRYVEMVIGPVLLIGFIELLTSPPLSKKFRRNVTIAFTLLGASVYWIIDAYAFLHFNPLHSVGLLLMLLPFGMILLVVMALLGARILRLTARTTRKKMCLNLFLITCLFFAMGNTVRNGIVGLNKERLEIAKHVDFIQSIDEVSPIYYLWNGENHPVYDQWDNRLVLDRLPADLYQFLLLDRQVILIESVASIKYTGPHFIIATEYVEHAGFDKTYNLYGVAAGTYLYASEEMRPND